MIHLDFDQLKFRRMGSKHQGNRTDLFGSKITFYIGGYGVNFKVFTFFNQKVKRKKGKRKYHHVRKECFTPDIFFFARKYEIYFSFGRCTTELITR